MKKKTLLLLSPIYLLAISGCSFARISSSESSIGSSETSSSTSTSESSSDSSSSSEQSSSDNSSSSSSSSEKEEDLNPALINSEGYLKFWNPSTYISLSINMSRSAANFINEHQSDHNNTSYFDYYVPCNVDITVGEEHLVFEEVGIRGKGNMSRTNCLINGSFNVNSLSHYKLNFQETFDGSEYDDINELKEFKKTWTDTSARKIRKDRTLYDMEKIDIKWNRNQDETKSKQSYALKLFRDNNVIAGHTTLADTYLSAGNDTPIKVTYEILECIDKVFIKRNFNKANSGGNLYKCTYTNMGPANLSNSHKSGSYIGIEDNVNGYHPIYDLKTNKKSPDYTDLKNLITTINDKSLDTNGYKNNINNYIDINEFIRYEAVAFLLGNFDDLRNNANNYYIYFDSYSKAHVIPYDFDRCLGAGCEGRQDYMTNFSPESTKMQCSGSWQSINLYWRTICKSTDVNSGHSKTERIEEYRALYESTITSILNNGVMSVESFTFYVNAFPSDYRGNPSGAGPDNASFEEYFNKKVSKIKEYYQGVK